MRLVRFGIALLALVPPAGCRSISLMPSSRSAAVPATASRDDVVALVNRNVTGVEGHAGLKSWRCTQAKFQMASMPMAADGTVIVEAPHSFRMRVSHPIGGGDELDVGSNTQEFWIWQKDMPNLLTARHEDMPLALHHFRIPFQPDWIMEVMGVTPIDGSLYELRPGAKGQVQLTARGQSPAGDPVRKVIHVDTRHGWVTAHELWSDKGQPIARAELSQHELDERTQTVLPRKIRIHWPEADLDLRITLKHLEINPPQLPEMVWQLPQKGGCPKLDMGEYARRQTGTPASPIQNVSDVQPQRESSVQPAVDQSPFPRSAALDAADLGARPFPDLATAPPPAASTAPSTTLPPRDQSAPLEPPGRVRLNDIGS